MTEIFLKARQDTIVVAFGPINDLNVLKKANQIYKDYPNRFMLISGVVSSNIKLFSTLNGNHAMNSESARFGFIFVACSFNSQTASMIFLFSILAA